MTGMLLGILVAGAWAPVGAGDDGLASPANRHNANQSEPPGSIVSRSQAGQLETAVHLSSAPVPGANIVVKVDGAEASGTTCGWKQVEGPPVAIDDPAATNLRFTIPEGAQSLGFVLTLRNEAGERAVRINIPVSREVEKPRLRADPGEDQVGLVGKRVTLNGTQSEPRGLVGYRWVQLGGPKVTQSMQDRGYYSFVPTAAGVYRFGLIVAAESQMSEPTEVAVAVGVLPAAGSEPNPAPAASPAVTLDRVARSAQTTLDGEVLGRVAEALEAIADRTSLYSTFADLSTEMTRRLDAIVPAERAMRQTWAQTLFVPLSQLLTSDLWSVGIDLRLPYAAGHALTRAQGPARAIVPGLRPGAATAGRGALGRWEKTHVPAGRRRKSGGAG
jgi:hypothetical protein